MAPTCTLGCRNKALFRNLGVRVSGCPCALKKRTTPELSVPSNVGASD